MYKVIKTDNTIFSSEDYQNDKFLFNIFQKKINNPNAHIMSDEENYIITNESEERAPWIYTKDNFDKTKLKEIEELIKMYLVKDKMTFTCKKELYNALVEDGFELIDKTDYFEVGFMKCDELVEPKQNDGWLDKAKPEEKELIASYIFTFEDFMDESVSNFKTTPLAEVKQQCLERAQEELNNENFYVLRNSNGKIVCMGHYQLAKDGTGKSGLIYTPNEERGKGYAAKLVYELTKKIMSSGYIPVLYTDQNYPNSNKAYANVGYVNRGTLINFSCDKKLLINNSKGSNIK